jgi:radical SAM protein with 4Fe4S-binding SPASM domain
MRHDGQAILHAVEGTSVEVLEYPHGSCILLLPESVTWVKTSSTGKWIFESLRERPRTLPELVCDVASHFGLPGARVERGVSALVDELLAQGVLRQGHDGAFPTQVPITMDNLSLQEVWFNLTDQCNLSCSFCYVPGIGPSGKAHVPYELAVKVIEEAAEMGVVHLVLAGGEPTLHPELEQIVRFASAQGTLRVKLVTNGSRCDARFVEGVLPHIHDLQVSLDGAEAKVHDGLRGKGSFNRAVELLRIVQQRAPETVRGISFTPQPDNLDQLQGLYRLALVLAVNYIHLNRPKLPGVQPIGTNGGWSSPEFFGQALTAYDQLLLHIFRDREMSAGLQNRACPEIDVSFDPASELFSQFQRKRCAAGILTVCIGPDGGTYPCAALYRRQFTGGRVQEGGLAEACGRLRSHMEEVFSVDHDEVCGRCRFRYFCGGGCRAVAHPQTERDPACELLSRRFATALGHVTDVRNSGIGARVQESAADVPPIERSRRLRVKC